MYVCKVVLFVGDRPKRKVLNGASINIASTHNIHFFEFSDVGNVATGDKCDNEIVILNGVLNSE